MKATPICHPDFAELEPLHVWHKEHAAYEQPHHPEHLKNRHILFRKRFVLPEFDPKKNRALLRITADDYYKLRINGMFVTQGPAPAYPSAYYYNEIDVTQFLLAGENVISVHQYYQGLVNRVWVSADLRSMLCCELELDGEIVLTTDETWKCADHTGYTPLGLIGYETQYCEQYDSRAPEVNFQRPDFDDSSWGYARLMKYADYTFVKQPTKQLVFEELCPVKRENLPGLVRVDFGQEAAGTLTVTAAGNPGDCVTVRYGLSFLLPKNSRPRTNGFSRAARTSSFPMTTRRSGMRKFCTRKRRRSVRSGWRCGIIPAKNGRPIRMFPMKCAIS